MTERIATLTARLQAMASNIEKSTTSDETLQKTYGWNAPPLTRHDLARLTTALAERISRISETELNPAFSIDPINERIQAFEVSVLPRFWDGSATAAYPAYQSLLAWIEALFQPLFKMDWEKLSADGLLPKQLTTKLNSYTKVTKRLGIDIESLEEKIKYVNQAHDAALALPTDLENLQDANSTVAELKARAEKNQILSQTALETINDLLSSIKEKEAEAIKLVENTEDAYSAATTKGLGEAFQQRADRLANSMWTWVGGLVVALAIGAGLGIYRVTVLQTAITESSSARVIWVHLMLAFLSVAAPIWFAWIATKQIGHRFRLSEDYAFKASVARAYEGYRREAARLDPEFAARLFKSALSRLDEAPIRFVEHETYGSPWHEMIRMRQKSNRGQMQERAEEPKRSQPHVEPENEPSNRSVSGAPDN